MDDELQKYALVELKYDQGKVFTVRRKWILHPKPQYSKTEDVFCYWSNNLEDSPEELMKCEYSKTFTGEPALFKVFVVKLADSLAEAEKYMQGRLKSVSYKFREPGNTDEEIRKMQARHRKSVNKELKLLKTQAHTLNVDYLIDEVKLQTPSSSIPVSQATINIVIPEDDNSSEVEEIEPPKPKKHKKSKSVAVPSKKIKYTKQNEAQKDELSCRPILATETSNDKTFQLSTTSRVISNGVEFNMSDIPKEGIEQELNNENDIGSDRSPKTVANDFKSEAYKTVQNIEVYANTADENTPSADDSISVDNFQPQSSTSVITLRHLEYVSDQEKNVTEEKNDIVETLSNSLQFGSFSNQISPLCEIPSTSFGMEFNELCNSIMAGTYEYPQYNQMEESHAQQEEDEQSLFIVSKTTNNTKSSVSVAPPDTSEGTVHNNTMKQVYPCESFLRLILSFCVNNIYQGGANVVVINLDELTTKYNDALTEVINLKSENESLKTELSKADRRNKLLQDYLVAVDERVPEILFVEKDGGRMYRDNIFLTKKQCAVLDKAKSDNEYINNLLVCVFGREVLPTHTLSGKRGKNKKDLNGQPSAPLDKRRLALIYDIMDARAVANKTKKLTKTEINAVITKKNSNLTKYAEKSVQEN